MSERSLTSSPTDAGSIASYWPDPLIEPNHQPTSLGLFPPACEPPVPSFPYILALPILTHNPCRPLFLLCSAASQQPATAHANHSPRPKAQPGM